MMLPVRRLKARHPRPRIASRASPRRQVMCRRKCVKPTRLLPWQPTSGPASTGGAASGRTPSGPLSERRPPAARRRRHPFAAVSPVPEHRRNIDDNITDGGIARPRRHRYRHRQRRPARSIHQRRHRRPRPVVTPSPARRQHPRPRGRFEHGPRGTCRSAEMRTVSSPGAHDWSM